MSWNFAPGDEIASGRRATALLGGGERYQAYLAWSDELLAPTVLKVLRPERVADPAARCAIRAEAEHLRRRRSTTSIDGR